MAWSSRLGRGAVARTPFEEASLEDTESTAGVEARAGDLRARVGQRGALLIGRGVRVARLGQRTATARADLERVTSAGEERRCRIGETLLLRTCDLGDPAVLDLRLLGRVGERFGDDAGGHELRSHLGHVATPSWMVHPTNGSTNSWNWAARMIRTGSADDRDDDDPALWSRARATG